MNRRDILKGLLHAPILSSFLFGKSKAKEPKKEEKEEGYSAPRKYWTIYPNQVGGWHACNCQTRKNVVLVQFGSFSEAVDVFEKKIGISWYQ